MQGVTVVDHPLVQHKLTLMRDKSTPTASFRQLLREIALLLTYEVTRDLKLTTTRIETPLAAMDAPILEGKKPVFASILRAGNGLLEGMLDLVPSARVAHIGLYRDPETLEPVEYYFKVPSGPDARDCFVLDPMLATGGSAAQALTVVKQHGATEVSLVCIVGAPEGVATVEKAHPEVPIILGALDRALNSRKYILPGLGDFGDRLYGT